MDIYEFKKNLNTYFYRQFYLWDLGDYSSNGVAKDSDYYIKLGAKLNLASEDTSEIANVWEEEDCDDEVENNFQRFYLFQEYLEQQNISPDLAVSLILAWIDKFPFSRTGKAWNSFNCSVRLINWIKLLSKTDEISLNKGKWEVIQKSIFHQVNYISRNIELHIPGNHVFIQYFSLWIMTSIFNNWTNSGRLNALFHENLIDETEREFLANGFHFEKSFHYHVQITLMGLIWICSSHIQNKSVPESIKETYLKAVRLINVFLLPNGTYPMIGDNCFNFIHEDLRQDIYNINRLVNHFFPSWHKSIPDGSLFDIQNEYVVWRQNDQHLIFDVGNIGLYENPGHGHSDILNVIYSDRGIPIFIDPGTRNYSNKPDDLALKKACNHNTVSVGEVNHAELWGFFRWGFLPDDPVYTIKRNNDAIYLQGEFAFKKPLKGLYHKRKIIIWDKELQIEDSIYGRNQKQDVFINFILSEGITCTIEGSNIMVSINDFTWRMVVQSELKFKIRREPFKIYKNYSLPVEAQKITITFKDIDLPVHSMINISRI